MESSLNIVNVIDTLEELIDSELDLMVEFIILHFENKLQKKTGS